MPKQQPLGRYVRFNVSR